MKNTFIMIVVSSLMAGCGVFGSFGSSAGSSGGSSGGSSAGSSGGSSAGLFGKKREKEIVLEQRKEVEDLRVLLPTVKDVFVERFHGGAIVRATALTGNIGYHNIHLSPVNDGLPDENGVVTFEFLGEEPVTRTTPRTERSREIIAANSISTNVLRNVSSIRVVAAQNQISVRKR
ncbi:hypothetical protein [Amylibacter sp. SFDW26]|uniref:hypothetical protein n=1 Tax=Amylibacter sp. SFDW26 TaxID=2652722 RepID=UPI00186A97C0|nr:hypothetical protein [Amylibacter sp. SFDW26]